MSLVERECVEKLVKAIKQSDLEGLSKEEREAAYKLLEDAYALFDEKIEDSDRANWLGWDLMCQKNIFISVHWQQPHF